jgi:hypothetical protein
MVQCEFQKHKRKQHEFWKEKEAIPNRRLISAQVLEECNVNSKSTNENSTCFGKAK